LLLLPGLLAVAACDGDSPAEPVDIGGDVEGSWTAISFSGNPLPIEELFQDSISGATCVARLEDVELSFLPDGTYIWHEDGTVECSGSPPESDPHTFTGTYRVENTKLFMADTDTPYDEFESGFSVENQTLTLRQRFGNVTLTSVFQRLTGG